MSLSNYLKGADIMKGGVNPDEILKNLGITMPTGTKTDIVGPTLPITTPTPTLPITTPTPSLTNYDADKNAEITAKEKATAEQKSLLEERYGTFMEELDASRQRQQEIAAVTLEKLRKYLPYAIKAQGLSGTGASESTLLSADANYANTMADIAANYDSNKRALDQALIDDKIELEQKLQEDKDEINAKYDDRAYQQSIIEDDRAYNEKVDASNTAYSNLLTQIQRKIDEYIDDEEDGLLSLEEKTGLIKYIEANGGPLTESDKANLLTYLEGYDVRSEDAQTEIDEAKAAIDDIYKNDTLKVHIPGNVRPGVDGDNLEIDYNNVKYDVELDSVASSDIQKNLNIKFNNAPTDGDCAVADGKIYIYASDGKWYSVRDRGGFNSTDWQNLLTALTENGAKIQTSSATNTTTDTSNTASTSNSTPKSKPGRNEHGKW